MRNLLAVNPYVSLPAPFRKFFLPCYIIFWIFLPCVGKISSGYYDYSYFSVLIPLLVACSQLLVVLPFYYSNFCGFPVGIFSPVVWPFLFRLCKQLFLRFNDFIAQPFVYFNATKWSAPLVLQGLPVEEQFQAELFKYLVFILGFLCFLLGLKLSLSKPFRTFTFPFSTVLVRPFSLYIFSLILLSIGVFYVLAQGGISNLFAQFSFGRFRTLNDNSYLLVLGRAAPLYMVCYGYLKPSSWKKLYFILPLTSTILLQFLMTGSRSSVFKPAIASILAFSMQQGFVPWLFIALTSLGANLFIGLAGLLRSSYGRSLDLELLLSDISSIGDLFDLTNHEIQRKSLLDTDNAIIGFANSNTGFFLNGASYISAFLFFVPRFIWESKPRGIGAFVSSIVLRGNDTASGYDGGGVPINGFTEAYWNFDLIGVVFISIVYGLIIGFIHYNYLRTGAVFWFFFLVLSSTELLTFSSPNIVPFLQYSSIFLFFLGLSRFGLFNAFGSGSSRTGDPSM